MTEREVITSKIARAQHVVEGIEHPGFTAKSRLRLDVDNPRRFLENYARVGLIKERLLEVSLPAFQSQLTQIIEEQALAESGQQLAKRDIRRQHSFTLPNGEIVDKLTSRKVDALKALPTDGITTIASSEWAQSVYQEDIENGLSITKAKRRVEELRDELQGMVDSRGYQIENTVSIDVMRAKRQEAQYRLVPITRLIEEGETVGSGILDVPDTQQITGNGMEEILTIPYEPSEEEKRSPQETKVLTYITDWLSSHTRLYFEDLQKELASVTFANRVRVIGGQRQFAIYQGADIQNMFNSALRKLREEAEIPLLKQSWGEEDSALWEKTQALIQRSSGNDTEAFRQMVAREIHRAERDFYGTHRPQNGDKAYWINI